MFRCIILTIFLGVAIFGLTLVPTDAEGCAAVGRGHDSIRIAEESAVIVWDPVRKIEHFIRSAAFDTKSPDFGFLVPTPSKPELKEVEGGIFREMTQWMRPKIIEQSRVVYDPFLCLFGCGSKSAMMSGDFGPVGKSVRVLGEQKVGGFDTAIHEADNTEDLSKWLKDNGYSSDPELQSWLVPYVGAKWKITAFKITQDPKTGQLATTKPVRMSFATDRPFFPYREPEAKKEKPKEPDEHQKKAMLLEGAWTVESAKQNGEPVANLIGTKFHFNNGVAVGRFLKDTKYSVNAGKEPKWLDLGKKPGIYKLDGDTLHWCQGSDARPAAFDSKEGLLLVLKLAKRRDPNENQATLHGNRLLRVFFISDTRVDGALGDAKWHARIPWSDQITDEQRKQIAEQTGVPADEIPATAWMTAFEDAASPRPGKEEVFFDPAQDRTPIRPPDIVIFHDTWIPIDVIVLGVLFVVFLGYMAYRYPARNRT